MIDATTLRLGNYILQKGGVRILPVALGLQHFDLLARGMAKDLFPIALNIENLKKCGFLENIKYYQHPEVREFILTLPVKGPSQNEIRAYVPATTPYARAMVNELTISNNIYHLHQLQNLYYALTGAELEVRL
ncbi:MAG: hypothetical protein LH478_03005 [Chitinophagaceae bacterium]|nr:hypothetical protein [Chitinophagaceae bacterium]